MKYIYALAAGVAFGALVEFVIRIVVAINNYFLYDWAQFLIFITAAIWFVSTLLFIDKIKNK